VSDFPVLCFGLFGVAYILQFYSSHPGRGSQTTCPDQKWLPLGRLLVLCVKFSKWENSILDTQWYPLPPLLPLIILPLLDYV
jgi:hypothetical protein